MSTLQVLPTGSGGANVGYITYSLEAIFGIGMSTIHTDDEIIPSVWGSAYTGGSTYSANALEAAWWMLQSSSRPVPKVVVTVTDGPGYLDELLTGELATYMQDYDDIRMYAISE